MFTSSKEPRSNARLSSPSSNVRISNPGIPPPLFAETDVRGDGLHPSHVVARVLVGRIVALAADDPISGVIVHRRQAEVAAGSPDDAIAAQLATHVVPARTADHSIP